MDLPDDLNDAPFAARLARLMPLVRTAAAHVIAYGARIAGEFEPGAAPTELRDTAARVLDALEPRSGPPDPGRLAALCDEALGHLDILVPEIDPGEPDPWETFDAVEFRAAVGQFLLVWALDVLVGDGRHNQRAWLEGQLADPRWHDSADPPP